MEVGMSQIGLIIYGVAALWAVQSLLALMQQHQKTTLIRLQREEISRREATAKTAEIVAESSPQGTRIRPAAVKS